MPSTVLIVGATGNTGRTAVRILSARIGSTGTRILAITRSIASPAAQALADLPGVEVESKNWTEIDAAWLQERKIERVYLAPHNGPSQYTDETEFHLALRNAGVKHVVRVSTLTHYVHADNPVYYGRSHWAVENFLDQSGMAKLGWTSLQPNFFTSMYIAAGAEWVRNFRSTGQQTPLQILLDEHTPVAMIDPADVGLLGAEILSLPAEKLVLHAGQRYVLAGPMNVNGRDVVNAVEKLAGVKVDTVTFRDASVLGHLGEIGVFEKRLLASVRAGLAPLWDGTSSKEGADNSLTVARVAKPQRTMEEALENMVNGSV